MTPLKKYAKEQARVERMIQETADILIRRVRSETPPANADLLEQWVGAFRLTLDYPKNPAALQFAQAIYRQLHTANHPR